MGGRATRLDEVNEVAGMVCTQTERDELAAAIKSGVMRVGYGDKAIQYQSLADMRAVLAEMDEYLAGASATTRYARLGFSRG